MNTAYATPPSLVTRILLAFAAGLILLLALLLVVNLVFTMVYANRILPGVSMNGIQLSGMSVDQATSEIARSIRFTETGSVLLLANEKSWAVAPVQLGVYLDPISSAKSAFAVGRRGSIDSILLQRFTSFSEGTEVFPTFIYDQKAAISYLDQVAVQINQPIREASLGLQGTEVIVNQGQPGRQLDYAASLDAITRQIQTMQDGVVQLSVVQSDPVILDASIQGEQARKILNQPFTLAVPPGSNNNEPVQIQPASLAQLLTFERITNGSGAAYQVAVNQALMTAYLNSIEYKLNTTPENARFIFNDDTRQIDLLKSATIGRKLNVENSVAAINTAIQSGSHNVDLVFDTDNPPVTDTATAAELGITELVESQTTYFRGSTADRVQNIRIASSQFHGLLIAPGETLSMAEILGDISLDNGYAEAMIILGDQTIKGVGGGVCQVSTALFRTAYYAGFQILERHSHAYRVGYYEQTSTGHNQNLAGLDATVFVPIVDLKFKNDTPYWLLMETYIYPGSYALEWKFYSTNDGRTVTSSSTGLTNIVKSPDPVYRENPDLPQGTKKQVDWAVDGATVTVNRTVTLNGVVLYNDSFYTRYQAWGDVYEYGPGTEIPTPTPKP
jgi:vancomycin resistance protein YoaR